MRTRVYVDGFNLYYGALKGTPFRWLDPVKLTALLLPGECTIDRLSYFTARVSGKLDPRAPARQQLYLKALATLPEVDIQRLIELEVPDGEQVEFKETLPARGSEGDP